MPVFADMPEVFQVRIVPEGISLSATEGSSLQEVLSRAGFSDSAYCGGQGKCGKCKVKVNGSEVLACLTRVFDNLEVELPPQGHARILDVSLSVAESGKAYSP